MSDAPIIEAKGLNLWYGPNHALKDISVAVPAHEITAFIGPSGCGKSTFLRTLDRMHDLMPNVKITGAIARSSTRSWSARCAAPPSGTR